jgi:hypothetical protein
MLGAVLLLSACAAGPVPTPRPSASPSPPAAYEALVMDKALKPLDGVRLRFWHPLYAGLERRTDALGQTDLRGLKTGTSYRVELDGEDLVPHQTNIWLPAGKALRLRFFLEHARSRLRGRAQTPAGQPVAGAIVQQGEFSAESDAQGQFELILAQPGSEAISVSKQGYRPCQPNQGLCQLEPLPAALRLRIPVSTAPLGLSPEAFASASAASRQAARDLGYELLDWTHDELDPARDTLWLVSPSVPLSEQTIEQIQSFVHAGGKLVVSGEWAGFGPLAQASLQKLVSGFGLALGGDSLHQSRSLEIHQFPETHSLTRGLSRLELYQSASVRVLLGSARLLAYSPADGYRIVSEGGQGVLGYALSGKGKVIVLGDSSLWLDSDSNGDGVSNFHSADNQKLWGNILGW